MNIPKEKLSLIGISIKVNRKARLKETKSGRWNQQNFSDGICSQNTLIKIERGQVSRFIEVYAEAAERLGLRLGYFPEVDKQIDRIAPKLYKAVEFYDLKKIMLYTNKLIEILEPYKQCLWYCDLLGALHYMVRFYNEDVAIEEQSIDSYIEMCGEFNEYIVTILRTIIFSSACDLLHDKRLNYSDVEKIYYDIQLDNSSSASNLINMLLYCLMSEKTTQFLLQLNKLETLCKETENWIRLLDAYSIAISYLGVMDRHEVENFISKFEGLLNTVEVPEGRLKDYYFGLGTALYEKDRYEEAIEYLNKSALIDENIHNINFVYIASAQRKLNLPIEIPYYSDKELKTLPEDIKRIYKYYKMDEDIPAFIRQRYIMEEILPKLSVKDEAVIGIIRDELLYLIETSNHYKDAVIFEIKCRQLLQK